MLSSTGRSPASSTARRQRRLAFSFHSPQGSTAVRRTLGRAILGYFSKLKPKFNLIAAFDTDENKIGRIISGCRCYHVKEIVATLSGSATQLGIITVPEPFAQNAADLLVVSGVKGIVNFAPTPLKVPSGVYLENMQMTMTFEKAAYFARLKK